MRIGVLLVDDDLDFRRTLRRLLVRKPGATIVGEARDGEEALRLTGALRPDVVLMDLRLPRMNGLEATRRLRTRWPDLPVIVITVHEDAAYRQTALAAGARAFLVKKHLGTQLWPTVLRLTNRSGP